MTHRTQRGFTLIELMIVVAILGLLAAIAIPAFSKYVRRSKTTEAVMNIRRIFDGAVKYYTEDHAARGTNAAIPNQFPGLGLDYGPAPGVNECCGQEGDVCMPNSNAWKHAVWQGLDFAVSDPHRYWYMFEPHGEGNESAFTARASGNLNCNQSFSTFERIGGVTEAGEVTGAAGIYSIRELE